MKDIETTVVKIYGDEYTITKSLLNVIEKSIEKHSKIVKLIESQESELYTPSEWISRNIHNGYYYQKNINTFNKVILLI